MIADASKNNWERFAQLSLDLVCTIDSKGVLTNLSDSCERILGYKKSELLGRNYKDFVYKDDINDTISTTQNVIKGFQTIDFENRLVHKDGKMVYFLWSAVWSEEDGIVFSIGRDITNTRENGLKLQVSEQRYKSLFNNNPDIIFIENKEGAITEANKAFQDAFGVYDAQLPTFDLSTLLTPDMASVCSMALEQALEGNSIRFDLELTTQSGERKVFDVVKQPIIVDKKVLYIQTIAKDITPIVRSYETIQQQANKLNTIFESITDAFFTLDKAWNLTYVNKEAESMLGISRSHHVGKNIWDIFPLEIGGEFHRQYLHAVATKTAVHFDAYYKQLKLWLSVKAFPSNEGLSVYFNDITEKVKSKHELEKLSLVASKTNNGVLILDSQFHIEWVNEGFTTLTAYTLVDALGKSPFQLLYTPKADHTFLEHAIQKMQRGEPVSFEILRRKKTGEDIWLLVQVNPIMDEKGFVSRYVFIQSDITEQVTSKKELELLSLVASETTNSVIIMNSEGQAEWVNKGFQNLTGYTLEDIRDKIPFQLLRGAETDPETISRIATKLTSKEPFHEEILIYTKSGEKKWFDVSVTPIFDSKGNIYKRVGIQSDITEKIHTQEELAKLAKDLYHQNSHLQQFTYMLSHNLRSPVANVLGFAKLLTSIPKEHAVFNNSLLKLQESALQLDKVLRDMNTILSIRDSKGNLELHPVNLRQVTDQVVSSLQEALNESKAELINELSDTLVVNANKAYLYSVFHNLLSNAIKYRAASRQLQVSIKCISHTSKGLIFSISDNGLGMDMGKVNGDLFKLYKRFHNHVTGTGIGLYLTKSHIEAMGGHIQVYSEVDTGTKFLIYLPS